MNNTSYSDFKDICRMCMLRCDIKFFRDNTISDIFYKLTDINFALNDELPQQICLRCFDKINEIHEFAVKCKQTHYNLLKFVNIFKKRQISEEQETEEINVLFKTEVEITNDEETDLIEDDVLNLTSKYSIDELKLKKEIVYDANNELEENMIPETSNGQNINCSINDLLTQNTVLFKLNIKVENEKELKDNVNLNDLNADTYSSDISDESFINSTENNKKTSKKTKDKHKSLPSFERLYECKLCLLSFENMGKLMYHKRSHYKKYLYKCEQCQKSFNRADMLRTHVRTHIGKYPFKCELCPKSFKMSSNYYSHMRVHSGVCPYKCEQCSKSFTRSFTLKVHMRVHSGERPHKCNKCSKSFSWLGSFKRHLQTHSGESPTNVYNVQNRLHNLPR